MSSGSEYSKELVLEYCQIGIETPELLHDTILIALLEHWKPILIKQRLLVDLKDRKTLVTGDIHGDYESLKKVVNYFESHEDFHYLIINGDVVDRGKYQIKSLLLIITMQIKFPERVYLIRGNHEDQSINSFYGFKETCMQTYNEDIYIKFNDAFAILPMAVKLGDWAFICHGGIPIEPIFFHLMRLLPKPRYPLIEGVYGQILWNDPREELTTWTKSYRGENIYFFGKEVVDKFLQLHNLKLILRAHEAFEEGYRWFFDKKLLSIFSSGIEPYEFVNPHFAVLDAGTTEVFEINKL
ncbi:MAG: metallophosphoesterase [Candidatus Heimdallarchaeota archaeon]|nr:metallophosphoesterase [Candidatus Heimdallarchaeota archaeon]